MEKEDNQAWVLRENDRIVYARNETEQFRADIFR